MKTTKSRFRIPELDDYITKQLEKIRKEILLNAEAYALRNLPPPDNNNIKTYWEEDHHKFESLLDEVDSQTQVKTGIDEVIQHKEVTEHRLRDVHNQQSIAKGKEHDIEAKLQDKKPPYNIVIVFLAYAATIVLFLFDGTYNIKVFTAWGSGYGEAILLGLFFAFLIAAVAHRFRWALSLGKTLWQKRLIGSAIFAVVACLSTYMAIYRAAYLEQQAFADTSVRFEYSSIPFILISMLIFSVSVAICFCLPSRLQRDAMRDYLTLLKEKQVNKAEQIRLKQEEQAIEQEHLALRQLIASTVEYVQSLKAHIRSKSSEFFGLFKKHNMAYRKDNCRPPSFDIDDGYPFTFNNASFLNQ